MPNTNSRKNEQGQITVLFAFAIVFLVLATGLAIDAGLCYVAKAKLSSAVDGACLAGMKSLGPLGQTTANTVATDIFYANYGPNPPIPAVTFPTDASGNQQVKVTATTSVRTLFMQIIPSLKTVPVSATAVATRAKLIMTIVVDRSGSMCGGTHHCSSGSGDLGGDAVTAAVPDFVANFDNTPNTGDEIGLVSFSDNSVINYSINYSFQTPIDSAISTMSYVGGTFGTGAGTGTLQSTTIGPPLSLAGVQNDSVGIISGQNVVKVVVYLTDGLMNTVQDKFHCKGKNGNSNPDTLLNYGGYDVSSGSTTCAAIMDPTSATTLFQNNVSNCDSPSGSGSNASFNYSASSSTCKDSNGNNVYRFPSQQPGSGGSLDFLQTNVTGEAKYRAKQTAIALETESPHPNYIYTIGLGSSVSGDLCTQALLATIANDPAAASYSCPASPGVYTTSQTSGEFFLIPGTECPGTGSSCTTAMRQVFQTIAAKILLRLTQ